MAIKDKKRFAELDALIRAGYGDMRQDDIPDAVMIAAEEGEEITEQGPARDRRFAKSVEEPPQRPPIKRKITPEARARARWLYRVRKEGNQQCQDACSGE